MPTWTRQTPEQGAGSVMSDRNTDWILVSMDASEFEETEFAPGEFFVRRVLGDASGAWTIQVRSL